MSRRYRELPEDCWELILNRLPHHSDFDSVSRVCKQLLKLTSQLCPKLIVTNALILTRTHNYISFLINKRFPNLNSIDFSNCTWNIEGLLLRMANNCALQKLREIDFSNVKKIPIKGLIELGSKIRGIRVLKCSKVRVFRNEDLVGIANLLPFLEELDISYPRNVADLGSGGVREIAITDAGIQVLAMNVKNLRKINVSGNDFVTDGSLVCLSENCVFLEGVDVVDCRLITSKGVFFVLRNSVHLNSISASEIDTRNGHLGSEDVSFSGRRLYSLDLRKSSISDDFMHMLADACVDLRRLSLYECSGFKVSSLMLLLRKCHTLQHLALCELGFIKDESVVEPYPYWPNFFTLFTFLEVAKSCPSLEFVKMECPESGIMDLKKLDSLKYTNIKSLNLSRSYDLVNKFLNGIALACPNLEILDISNCKKITENCLGEILDACHETRILRIAGCHMNSIGKGSVLPKLEVLDAAHSAINDEGLAQIAIRCPKVVKLGLAGCYQVTDTGVEEVLRSCEKLKELNLWLCPKVDTVSMVPWMISTRPTLVKIVPPFHMLISNSKKKFYLQHGCQILNGSKYRISELWE